LRISNALEILNTSDFFQSDVLTKMNAIYFSLTDAEPFKTAKVLVKLNGLKLLTEDNFNRMYSNFSKYNVFSSVFNKLISNGNTSFLLTQENLDKLLGNSELNLDVLAKFIQVDNESTILTQEKFDSVIVKLKNLLTPENISKIKKANFDRTKLADALFLLDQAKILTQDNINTLVDLSKEEFEKNIVPVLSMMYEKEILNQKNFNAFFFSYMVLVFLMQKMALKVFHWRNLPFF
jgi:hypothetical protein